MQVTMGVTGITAAYTLLRRLDCNDSHALIDHLQVGPALPDHTALGSPV
jgi:hypothetical protein